MDLKINGICKSGDIVFTSWSFDQTGCLLVFTLIRTEWPEFCEANEVRLVGQIKIS